MLIIKQCKKINFTEILNQPVQATMFFITKEAKVTILNLLLGTLRVL